MFQALNANESLPDGRWKMMLLLMKMMKKKKRRRGRGGSREPGIYSSVLCSKKALLIHSSILISSLASLRNDEITK